LQAYGAFNGKHRKKVSAVLFFCSKSEMEGFATRLKEGAHVSAFPPVVKRVSLPDFEGLDRPASILDSLAEALCCIVFDRVGGSSCG
jgi:hypothetical protein